MQYTYDEFDAMCEKMEMVYEDFPTEPYFPSEIEIAKMVADVEKYYDFIVYLTTNNPAPSSPEESLSMKLLNDIIRDNTEFIE